MRKTVAYYRSSTDLQENSIPMQHDFAHRFAVQQVITIDEEFEDAGVSARKNTVVNRPEMFKLIQEIQKRNIGRVVIYKRDRLARNAVEYMEFYRLCRDRDVQILFTAKNEFPVLYTPLGEFIELIMAGMVEHEADQIADRIRATHLANFMNKTKTGNLPYGLIEVKKKNSVEVTIAFESADVKRELTTIFTDYRKLRCSLREFAQYLDELGFMRKPRKPGKSRKRKNKSTVHEGELDAVPEPKPRAPHQWNEQEIEKIITSHIFKGVHRRQFGDEFFEVERPECQIVSHEEWEEANQILQSFLPKEREHPPFDFWLDGFLPCPQCQKTLVPEFRRRKDQSFPTYECAAKNHNSKKKMIFGAEELHRVVMKQLITVVEEFLLAHRDDFYNECANARKAEVLAQIQNKKTAVQKAEADFAHVVSASLHEDFNDPSVVEKLTQAYTELENKRNTMRDLEIQLEDRSLFSHVHYTRTEQAIHVLKILKDQNWHEVRKVLIRLIHKIEVDQKEGLHLTLKYPLKKEASDANG
jgi:site-specific DNA recombinase